MARAQERCHCHTITTLLTQPSPLLPTAGLGSTLPTRPPQNGPPGGGSHPRALSHPTQDARPFCWMASSCLECGSRCPQAVTRSLRKHCHQNGVPCRRPPGPLPRLTRGAPGWEVGASGRRPCPHLWDSPAAGIVDMGPLTAGLLGICLPPPGRGAAAKTGLALRWGSGWLGNQGTQLLQAQACRVPSPRCPLQPPRRGWATGTRPLL